MPLRVAIVAPWGERLGGAEEGLWQALLHWDRSKIEPNLIFLGAGPFEDEVRGLGIETEVIPAARLRRPLETVATIRSLSRVLRETDPDLVLDWSAKAHLYGRLAVFGARWRGPVVWWQHMIPHGHWIDRAATVMPADAIGCWSSASRKAQERLRPRRSTFVVNPGVDLDGWAPSGDSGLRKQLDIPDDRLVVGIVGRLQPWKGQDKLLRAVADLVARGRDVHALVVGGDAYGLAPEYARSLERLVDDLGLEGRATLTGQVDDPNSFVEIMDVAVNASDEEPFGIVLIEAMAAGVPVVAVAKGGPPDIIEHGVTGILAADAAPTTLADAIDQVIADPGRRRAMGAAGRARCLELFTAQAMADRLLGRLVEIAEA